MFYALPGHALWRIDGRGPCPAPAGVLVGIDDLHEAPVREVDSEGFAASVSTRRRRRHLVVIALKRGMQKSPPPSPMMMPTHARVSAEMQRTSCCSAVSALTLPLPAPLLARSPAHPGS